MTTPPGVIPYVDVHDGPKRLVTLTLEGPRSPLSGFTQEMVMPNVFVDGRQFVVYWGQVTVEAPADRPVHLAVGMQDGVRGASVLLDPGAEPLHLHYRVPVTGAATLGPAGQA
jgi:hypothetical protein